jgi:hypothetical protein
MDQANPFSLDASSTIANAGQVDTQCTLDYVNIPGEALQTSFLIFAHRNVLFVYCIECH